MCRITHCESTALRMNLCVVHRLHTNPFVDTQCCNTMLVHTDIAYMLRHCHKQNKGLTSCPSVNLKYISLTKPNDY